MAFESAFCNKASPDVTLDRDFYTTDDQPGLEGVESLVDEKKHSCDASSAYGL